MTLRDIFHHNKETPSDINQHLETLRSYASRCESICELGVRGAVSTSALLYGLSQSTANTSKKRLLSVDLTDCPKVKTLAPIAAEYGINFKFEVCDSVKIDIPTVDLLFIDTWHVYAHLKRELAKHHSQVQKYIIMHDTEIDKIHGESVRMGQNIERMSKISGYPADEISKGLYPAIQEFLVTNKEWKIDVVLTNNNGLTILERC